jgi:hypothetical protein
MNPVIAGAGLLGAIAVLTGWVLLCVVADAIKDKLRPARRRVAPGRPGLRLRV